MSEEKCLARGEEEKETWRGREREKKQNIQLKENL
jgi:hypothetical protein